MKKTVFFGLLVITLLFGFIGCEIGTITIPPAALLTAPNEFEMEVLRLVNEERGKAGRAPLQWDSKLALAARRHSKDMHDRNFFSHICPNGKSFSDRAEAAGFTGFPTGENIAAGYTTPAEVMDGWMNSTGHKANILNSSSTHLGVGYVYGNNNYKHYWTQVFGRF